MNKSDSITELASALAKAQAELKNPAFDSANPHFKSKYASLAAVRDAVIPILSKHGLSVAQLPVFDDGKAGCETVLMHSSGEYISSTLMIPVDRANAHGVGSATTYSRRFSLMALAGVVGDEDDDGNASVDTQKKRVEPDSAGKRAIEACESIDDLQAVWKALSPAQRATLGPIKDAMKEKILGTAEVA